MIGRSTGNRAQPVGAGTVKRQIALYDITDSGILKAANSGDYQVLVRSPSLARPSSLDQPGAVKAHSVTDWQTCQGQTVPLVHCRYRIVCRRTQNRPARAIFHIDSEREFRRTGYTDVSIFSKPCPQCASDNPADVLFCVCGYCFDLRQVRTNEDALTHASNEEQNYLDYLIARVSQTEADLEAKYASHIISPESTALAAEVLLAQQALNTARAELRAQQERVESLTNQRKTFRRISAQAVKPSRTGILRKVSAHQPEHPGMTGETPPPAAKLPVRVNLPHAANTSARHKEAARPSARAAVPPKSVAIAKTRPVAPVANNTVKATARKRAPGYLISETPGAAFHAVQAAKAAQAVQTPHAIPGPAVTPIPVQTGTPLVEIRGHSVTVTLPPPVKALLTHDCPNCMAKLPAVTHRCKCGFDLTAKFEMPALSLSAAERTLLLSSLGILK